MGRQVVRDIPSDASVEELCAANKLNLYDPDLHADPRWRHDRLWPFFAYDWLMKSRIVAYN